MKMNQAQAAMLRKARSTADGTVMTLGVNRGPYSTMTGRWLAKHACLIVTRQFMAHHVWALTDYGRSVEIEVAK